MDNNTQCLSTWNQVAPRSYVRQVYCFPYQAHLDDLEPLRHHIASALALASEHYPDVAGQLVLGTAPAGQISISKTSCDQVPLEVFDHRATFGYGYADLKARGFPASAFVDPSFNVPYKLAEGGRGVPAAEIHARVIDGGLLLYIYFHHSITDGIGMCNFISTFATYTRSGYAHRLGYPADIHVDLPVEIGAQLIESRTFEDLMTQCPEYVILPDLSGPTVPRLQPFGVPLGCIQKTGRIFAFGPDEIEALKTAVKEWRLSNAIATDNPNPSTFACLAALTWSYTTVMRMEIAPGSDVRHSIECNPSFEGVGCRLLMPVSWARRAFQDITKNYAGNAIALPNANSSLRSLSAAACSSPDSLAATGDSLGSLVHSIETALASVNDESVTTRTAMFRAAPDPRIIGVNLDPRDPRDFAFNSWRHLGADTLWGIPGTGGNELGASGVPPDAVRRAQDAWNMGAGLIMPGCKQSRKHEVLVTLDTVSMMRLCSDERWKSWVDEIIL
ncbi:hypothetical protein TOPH_08669 [Tolypocladium ophioglossoides CBS 100239]|uniref:Trichothecene 3-O-acetyltransferase-like N-terminal domain-containing protein n=1 Tax=Tolypocladium ophioglossoides (strain CBS 100239) TaxID=1163406 RepID=A0A0L0MY49_TOLOC|nr:hypothetical protein TOPH_08669 [Tolypocladium ophioglossoides CBS 100239]